jgi:riboflavin kinase/FMN adenylyltransferase
MQIVTSLEALPKVPMALTIGAFDGLHLGHQAILAQLRSYGVPTCVLTFAEHPLKTLQPERAPQVITPVEVKCSLLKTDYCLLLEFTKEFASMSYSELLERIPVSHLVFGKGAVFGRGREGTEANVRAWTERSGVHVEYIDKIPGFSSTAIRSAIQAGHLEQAEKLLGRPHLLFAPSQRFSAENLVLPPDGIYPLLNNELTIKNRTISLSTPVDKPTVFSFKGNYV